MQTELKKIIYVEDEPDIQEIARIALEAVGGLTVDIYSNGNDAVAAASDFEPDLILLDVMMPTIDGPTTLAEFRKVEQFADTPAIFMTAKVQPNEVDALLAHGGKSVV